MGEIQEICEVGLPRLEPSNDYSLFGEEEGLEVVYILFWGVEEVDRDTCQDDQTSCDLIEGRCGEEEKKTDADPGKGEEVLTAEVRDRKSVV